MKKLMMAVVAAVSLSGFGAWQPGLKQGIVSNRSGSTEYATYPTTVTTALTYDLCNKGTGMGTYQTAVCWGQFRSEAKTYAFTGKFDDTVVLYIDGKLVMDSTPLGDCKQAYGTVTLTEGWHNFEFRCGNKTGGVGGSLGGWALKYGIPDEDGSGVYNRTLKDDGNMTVFRYDDGVLAPSMVRVYCGGGFGTKCCDGPTAWQDGLSVGDTFEMTAEDVVGDGWKDVPTGYIRREYDAASETWAEIPVDGETTIEWTVTETPVEFVWLWERKFDVEMTAGEGGTVTCENGWKAAGGKVTVTATPNTGFAFLRWDGAVPRGFESMPSFTEPLGEKLQAKAVFTDKVLTVAKDGVDADNTGDRPFATIAAAVAAAEDDTVILVADGTYTHTATTISRRIVVRGASGDRTQVTLSPGTSPAFTLKNAAAAVVSLTVKQAAPALVADAGIVADVVFNGCKHGSSVAAVNYASTSTASDIVSMRKCLFLSCSGSTGGAISGAGSKGKYYISDSQFIGCSANWNAYFSFEGSPKCDLTVDRCVFRNGGPSQSSGVSLVNWQSTGTFSLRNSAVIGLKTSTALAKNTAGAVKVSDVIFRDSGSASPFTLTGTGTSFNRVIVESSRTQTIPSGYFFNSRFASATDGVRGNLSADPQFVKPYSSGSAYEGTDYLGGLHVLRDESPCIDRERVPVRNGFDGCGLDLDGEFCPMAGKVGGLQLLDVGCYEKLGPNAGAFRAEVGCQSAQEAVAGEPIVMKSTASGADRTISSAVWHVSAKRGYATETWAVDVGTADTLTLANPAAGIYSFSVDLENASGEKVSQEFAGTVVRGVRDVYVAPSNAGDAFPWDTPETASTNLQLAADLLVATDDQAGRLHILPGTYTMKNLPKARMADGSVYGLVLSRNIQAVAEGDEPAKFNYDGGTIFRVDHQKALLSGVQVVSPVSTGFYLPAGTISNCQFSAGGTSTVKGRLIDCKFSGYGTPGDGVVGLGGGAVMEGCTVERMTGYGNTCWGTVMTDRNTADTGKRWIRNCRICNNVGSVRTLCLENGKTVVENCILTNNTPSTAVVLGGGDGTVLVNSLVANNGATSSGAAIYTTGSPKLWMTNSTVVANAGIGVNGNVVVFNSIVWQNATDIVSASEVKYSCFGGAESFGGTGNIDKDPRFVFGEWPYRINYNSPCRNVGMKFPGCEALVGLDGKPRVFGRGIDMGCYENPGAGLILFVR